MAELRPHPAVRVLHPTLTGQVLVGILQVPPLEPPHVGQGGGGGPAQARCKQAAGKQRGGEARWFRGRWRACSWPPALSPVL